MIKAPQAEMGNLLPLNPKIQHSNRDGRRGLGFGDGPRELYKPEDSHWFSMRAVGFREVACVHAYLYGISSSGNKSRFAEAKADWKRTKLARMRISEPRCDFGSGIGPIVHYPSVKSDPASHVRYRVVQRVHSFSSKLCKHRVLMLFCACGDLP